MKSTKVDSVFLYLCISAFLFFCLGNSATASTNTSSESSLEPSGMAEEVRDATLTADQNELLELAFEVATLIPVNPHIKDRSKVQAQVVDVALKLDQPQRALRYIGRIDDWRRGVGYADLAFYYAQRGYLKNIPGLLGKAEKVSETTEDWRRDQIRVKIAKTYAYLGQKEKADIYESDVVDSEKGKVAGVETILSGTDTFESQISELDGLIASDNFDIVKNALESYTRLFDSYYGDKERRSIIADKIQTGWVKVPVFIRVNLLMEMAEVALKKEDSTGALGLVNDAQLFLFNHDWPVEFRIPTQAKLIKLRFLAGDKERAREEAGMVLSLYKQEWDKIINIYRAGVLRPLAETYVAMGDMDSARSVYQQVLEEGMENPNSRPRAEDLAATCCSMAVSRFEVDEELWDRIRNIHKGLKDPW